MDLEALVAEVESEAQESLALAPASPSELSPLPAVPAAWDRRTDESLGQRLIDSPQPPRNAQASRALDYAAPPSSEAVA